MMKIITIKGQYEEQIQENGEQYEEQYDGARK